MAVLAFPAHADVWRLYDGDGTTPQGKIESQAGVTCTFYNTAAYIRWRNKGGDWVDVNGKPQGDRRFATAGFAVGVDRPQVVNMDVTRLIGAEGFVFRRNGDRVVRIASRETATPPVLTLTLADGSTVTKHPIADASLPFAYADICQSVPTGKATTMSLGYSAVVGFGPWPAEVVKARLTLTISSASGPGLIEVYKMVVPRMTTVEKTPVDPNPGVYFYESWETDDWWTHNGGNQKPSAQWQQDDGRFNTPSQNGLWIADGTSESVPAQGTNGVVQVKRGNGARGRGPMIVYHPDLLAYGVDLGNVVMNKVVDGVAGGPDPEEAWLTYKVKYGKSFRGFARCEGGKAPGLSGSTAFCAGSAVPANGYCGWSLRQSYRLICDPNNPAYGHVLLHTYAYHGLMPGYYGQGWFGGDKAMLTLDEWHCVEQRVKVNTPGAADGINQVYIDGKLAIDKTDVYLRAVKPQPEGYSDWRRVTSKFPAPAGAKVITDNFGRSFYFAGGKLPGELGITKAYMVVHNGA